jgi:hypothetical protein
MSNIELGHRRALVATLGACATLAALLLAPGSAFAAGLPIWTVGSEAGPTNLPPGGSGRYLLHVRNVGTVPTDGSAVTVVDHLPEGIEATAAGEFVSGETVESNYWQCSGTTVVTCANNPVNLPTIAPGAEKTPPGSSRATAPLIGIDVLVSDQASSPAINAVSVSGGGAGEARSSQQTTISSSPAPFGLAGFEQLLLNADGSPATVAGSHPFTMITNFSLNNLGGEVQSAGEPKDLRVDLPSGFVGNPKATPRCPRTLFDERHNSQATPRCPADTQIGVEVLNLSEPNFVLVLPVYNLEPPKGVAAQFGFGFQYRVGLIDAGVRAGEGYGLKAELRNILQLEVLRSSLVLWGVPADHSHDAERGECLSAEGGSCPSDAAPKPLFTMPTSCGSGLSSTVSADSWPEPGTSVSADYPAIDNQGNQLVESGCDALQFNPTFEAQSDTSAADSPSGLQVDLHVPQNEEPQELATSHLRGATVTLPQGLDVNPSSANGLQACTSAQIGLTSAPGATPIRFGAEAAQCPDASKLGSVVVDTPLLDHSLPGAVYLAKPFDNPFDSLLAIYIAVDDPISGVVVKLAGHVIPDPQTGQLTTSFEENPQLPFEDFKLDFFGGPRAALRTPSICGTFTTTTDLVPWSGGPDANPSSSFKVSSGPNGSACATDPSQRSLNPSFQGGTLNPVAGAFSPFVMNLRREDGQQELSSLNVTTPPGIAADLRGVPYCPEAALAQAAQKSGKAEQANPSCPATSQVGTVNVGVGAGPDPYYVGGKVYLAGTYKSAPLSLAIVTPATAGPFDLGTVVVRAAAYLDPTDAHLHVVSDPLPHILAGIPLDLRDVRVAVDRPHFTNNPTYCDPMALFADVFGSAGAATRLTERFQVGDCGALGFKPRVSLDLRGGTRRSQNPALTATVTYPKRGAYANIASAQVTLPPSEFLDQAHISAVCTRVQFAEGQTPGEKCPAGSVYGHATATTPLLDQPLSGPVYLRSNPQHVLPDLVAALDGQIDIVLAGRVDSGKGGGLRNSFEVVPDAPVSRFTLTMKGGNKGLLENSENLCAKPQHAIADLTAQNGKVHDIEPVVENSCGGKKHSKHGRGGG